MHNSPITKLTSFEDILDAIEKLSREHLLYYRVQLGGLLLDSFWDGDSAAFSKAGPKREPRFQLFFDKHGDALTRYGLSIWQARNSVRAAIVMRSLPPEVALGLMWSQVVELTRLKDPTARARVAVAAIEQDWTVSQLRDAVTATRAGLPLDSDPQTPGLQLHELSVATPPPAPGRMVTRVEKLASEVELWSVGWRRTDASKLRPVQRRRLEVAVTALEAQVMALRRVIAAGSSADDE